MDSYVSIEIICLEDLEVLEREIRNFRRRTSQSDSVGYKTCYCLAYTGGDFMSASYVSNEGCVDRILEMIDGDEKFRSFSFHFDNDKGIASSRVFSRLISGIICNRPFMKELRLIDIGCHCMVAIKNIIAAAENITVDTLVFGRSDEQGDISRRLESRSRNIFPEDGCRALLHIINPKESRWLKHFHLVDYVMPQWFFISLSNMIRCCGPDCSGDFGIVSVHLHRCCMNEDAFVHLLCTVKSSKVIKDFGIDANSSYSEAVVKGIDDIVKKNCVIERLLVTGEVNSDVWSKYGVIVQSLKSMNTSLFYLKLASADDEDDRCFHRYCVDNENLNELMMRCKVFRREHGRSFCMAYWPMIVAGFSSKLDHIFALLRSYVEILDNAGVGCNAKKRSNK